MTARDNIEAASKRCAEATIRLLELQFMAVLLEAIIMASAVDCLQSRRHSGRELR
jgi:hypothetical protein